MAGGVSIYIDTLNSSKIYVIFLCLSLNTRVAQGACISARGLMAPRAWMKPTMAGLGQRTREDVAVEKEPMAARSQQVWGQEGEAAVVTLGEHNNIYRDVTCALTKFGMEKEK